MRKTMDRICQHCGELIVGKADRVTERSSIPALRLALHTPRPPSVAERKFCFLGAG